MMIALSVAEGLQKEMSRKHVGGAKGIEGMLKKNKFDIIANIPIANFAGN